MKRKQLTVSFVRSVTEPGRYGDGYGLMLVVKPTGGRSWIQRLVIQGRRRDIGLGSLDRVSLAQARKVAFENRNVAREGGDPTARAEIRRVQTFEEAADIVIKLHAETWRDGGKTANQWRASLRDYVMPRLARRPVNTITSADVLAVLMPIWNTKRETARRVRQRIGAICKWAIAEGHRDDNPSGDAIAAALPRNGSHRQHFRAVHYSTVSGALATVRDSGAWWATKAAFEFLTLTAARSGEVRGMRWHEVDLDAAIWTVPGQRMKAGRDHRVPLSTRAVAILEDARGRTGGSGLVFPSITGRVMSDSTLSKLVKELGIEGTPHGMRSAFRDWASERTNTPHAVMEAALAHTIKDKVEAAYARSDLLAKRRNLMDAWSRFLDTAPAGKIVSIR